MAIKRNKNETINDPRVKECKSKNGKMAIFVQLCRHGSGGYLIEAPDERWMEDMQALSQFNYGEMTVLMRPTFDTGYDRKYGCYIVFFPGQMDGQLDGTRRGHVPNVTDPHWAQGKQFGAFAIETNLDHAINLHQALGKVIRKAKALTKKEKNRRERQSKAQSMSAAPQIPPNR